LYIASIGVAVSIWVYAHLLLETDRQTDSTHGVERSF
jgi:hypothetical protein